MFWAEAYFDMVKSAPATSYTNDISAVVPFASGSLEISKHGRTTLHAWPKTVSASSVGVDAIKLLETSTGGRGSDWL